MDMSRNAKFIRTNSKKMTPLTVEKIKNFEEMFYKEKKKQASATPNCSRPAPSIYPI